MTKTMSMHQAMVNALSVPVELNRHILLDFDITSVDPPEGDHFEIISAHDFQMVIGHSLFCCYGFEELVDWLVENGYDKEHSNDS